MATLTFDAVPQARPTQKPAEGPRKRRKRAAAAGAADDCFTCANRQVKCDRGRPYCTPCLQSGQDCAGYKTQLTWGVGVASRGKLRGLSLPVAGTKKVAESVAPSPTKKKRTASSTTSTAAHFAAHNLSLPLSPESGTESVFTRRQNGGHQSLRSSLSLNSSLPMGAPHEMLPSPASSHMDMSPINIGWPTSSSMPSQGPYALPPVSPLSYSALTQSSQYFEHLAPHYHESFTSMDGYPSMNAVVNANCAPDHTLIPYLGHAQDYGHDNTFRQHSEPVESAAMTGDSALGVEDDVEEVKREDNAWSDTLSIASSQLLFDMSLNWSPFSGANVVGKTPRMQYLIQYYAEVISPVIVAFDSPSNPFKDQILGLAANSDSLQHALSALAASNLRQRKESGALSTGKTLPARRSSQAHLSLTTEAMLNSVGVSSGEPKREEAFHKYHAVQSLNAALASPHARKDDSVLATLLILCLFHVCDSGIARFQTQFAGVKKLLMLRRNERGREEAGTKWMTRLFTWFDAMAATVNEREGQFDIQSLESSALSDEEWSFETLAGVDGRLFKAMSQLGRLNILSQGKTVESNPTLVSRPLPVLKSPHTATSGDFHSFDGNGWMRVIEDENFFMSKSAYSSPSEDGEHHAGTFNHADHRSPQSEQFWREWREVRQQLQTWNLDTLLYETQAHPSGRHLTEEQRLDIDNISNAFRFSALLYTERLGNPNVPSSHENIQYWVRRALHHIKRVRSDVYLLWPLFITGSECVHEEGRNVIRERCEDIQKDSGFVNNASCLALLEKVWKVVPTVPSALPTGAETHIHSATHSFIGIPSKIDSGYSSLDDNVNGFRFRDVMTAEGNDGEWIVV